jgi:hypothetical protein
MRRSAIACLLLLASTATGCAVGVRGPVIEISRTSAEINGKALSTVGGQGSYHVEYGTTAARTQSTPARTVTFARFDPEFVTEPLVGLAPGETYHFAICAEDSENPGNPFCSPDRTFTTDGDSTDSVFGTGVRELAGTGLDESWHYDVSSGPSGENAEGHLIYTAASGRRALGTVRCLAVSENRAVIGLEIDDPLGAHNEYDVLVDGGPGNADSQGIVPSTGPPTDCGSVPDNAPVQPFGESTIVIFDGEEEGPAT